MNSPDKVSPDEQNAGGCYDERSAYSGPGDVEQSTARTKDVEREENVGQELRDAWAAATTMWKQ